MIAFNDTSLGYKEKNKPEYLYSSLLFFYYKLEKVILSHLISPY